MKTYRELLSEFIKFKSISTDPAFSEDVEQTAEWLAKLFKANGFETSIVKGYDNPIVVSSYVVDPKLETCLIYGHYDVQPAAKEDGWDSDPFELVERNGRLYARGAIDNKGQVFVHIYTVLNLIAAKKLKYNVKFMLEGNEETGSPNLGKFLRENKKLVAADFVLLSDGEITAGHPTIELGFRGIFNTTVTLTVSDKDLHSGLFGGTTPNAGEELAKLLADMFYGPKINIPGFYDSVKKVEPSIVKLNKKLPFTLAYFRQLTGTTKLVTEQGYDFYTQNGMRPSAEITGFQTGYVGEGYRNSIPATAVAKINFRLTSDQDPAKMAKLFTSYVKHKAPKYSKVNVVVDQLSWGVRLDINNRYVDQAKACLAKAYASTVLPKYCGATLPIVADFKALLKVPQVLAPLVNEDCRMHAANENFDVKTLNKAMKFSELFFTAR